MALDTSGIFLTNLLTFLINCPISRREHKHVILSGLESSVCGFIESFSGTIQRCGSSCHLPFNHQSVLGRISCFLTSSRFDSLPLGKMCVCVCVCVCVYYNTHTHAHTKYHVYELRILLNRFKRLKNLYMYMCIRVLVYIHPSMITTGIKCKYKHIPDDCSNIWMRNFSKIISPIEVKKKKKVVLLLEFVLTFNLRPLILKS